MDADRTHFEDQIDIDAPIDAVWALTTDIEAWPSFSPTMTRIERLGGGPLAVGSTARVKQPGQRSTVWTVTTLDPPVVFEWRAKVLGMTMTAAHRLDGTESGCRQTLSVDLAGTGSKMLARFLGRQIAKSLATENSAFKAKSEKDRPA